MFSKWPHIAIVALIIGEPAFAQELPVKKDSTTLYKNIETYSKHNRLTKAIYSLIFKPVVKSSKKKEVKKRIAKKPVRNSNKYFEGKIIRHIHIETLDPFGYSITDTLRVPHTILPIAGNRLHVKSQNHAIRNWLLIKPNQPFDSLLVKESERLVRSQGFVRDVAFSFKSTSKNSDSVDIFIREMDNWSIIPYGNASLSGFSIDLTDKNFSGLGHEAQTGLSWYKTSGKFAYLVNYSIPNIRNTYINGTVHYNKDEQGNQIKSFSVNRPFFSPLAKWAAGISFSQQFRREFIHTSNSLFIKQPFKYNTQDYWVGAATQIFKGNSEDFRTTNFISAIRFFRVRYLQKPLEIHDQYNLYSNEDFYLATLGISARKYTQDKYVFQFGVTEDVPIGKVYSITGGYRKKPFGGQWYLGARFSHGNYYRWGYLSSNFEYGTFLRKSGSEQGVFSAGINYFTLLHEIGRWSYRQFVKPQVVIGINRLSNDTLTLNDGNGIDGFNSSVLSGTSRLLLTLQTQLYAPWNVLGFRFGPFLSFSLGTVGNSASGFQNSKVYSQIGIGVLIKNENLVFNMFQISISFYPSIPGDGQNLFKTNSFKTTDFGFRDFEIGKPSVVDFQ